MSETVTIFGKEYIANPTSAECPRCNGAEESPILCFRDGPVMVCHNCFCHAGGKCTCLTEEELKYYSETRND